MENVYKAVRISDHVYWVGAIDWHIRDFHGYATQHGSTYNAYLIVADKITLMDTVRAPFREELLSRISSVVNPGDIDYIVSHHAEMDHSGSLPRIIEEIRPANVYASVMGAKALKEHFGLEGVIPLKSGDTLDLGNMRLSFMETRMLHWPDSMFSYLEKDGVLFSQDAFGMHLASAERFVDEIDDSILDYEAATYYANILMPFSQQVLKLLDDVKKSGLDIRTIAPDHGPVRRGEIDTILKSYEQWARQAPTNKAIVLYDTMWHSTEMMARAIEEGLLEEGARVKVISMHASLRSDAAYEILDAGALVAGSPTLNNNIFPTMADVLTYLKGLRPQNLVGAAFGSYGWSGEAAGHTHDILAGMKVDPVAEPLRVKYVPGGDDLKHCVDLGRTVAHKLKEVTTCG
jgi:flavorubredoxin